MRRTLIAALFVLGLAVAGGFTANVVASTSTGTTATGTTGTDTSTTSTTPTTAPTTTTTTTTPKPRPKPRPKPVLIPPGVAIAGIPVGQLTPAQATAVVRKSYARPVPLLVAGTRYAPRPERFGAVARVALAVAHAKSAKPGTDVPVVLTVKGAKVRDFVAALATRFNEDPVDSVFSMRGATPYITADQPGRRLRTKLARQALVQALVHNTRTRVKLDFEALAATVTRDDFGKLIVIQRRSNRLTLYDGMHTVRAFGVATGQAIYPTPLGKFSIVVKWVNPWWYPPNSAWAKGEKPVPPGPGNPLGTRWMGLSSPGVGIHGTPNDSSIGYSESHGCIRMHIPDAEWLFAHVDVGTTVYIVNA